tara:strand:+ start:14806 stop:15333 length:528 start_codon:yes stop_codon:yes gene_type:complete
MTTARQGKVLPQWVDPLKLAGQGAALGGFIPSGKMTRLAEAVASVGGPVQVSLQFFRDESGYRVATGDVAVPLELVCQRCLQGINTTIALAVQWAIVADEEQVQSLPKQYDPWLVTEEGGNLHRIVEEDLLLALPIVAFHEPDQCDVEVGYSSGEFETVKKPGPFEILQNLQFKK